MPTLIFKIIFGAFNGILIYLIESFLYLFLILAVSVLLQLIVDKPQSSLNTKYLHPEPT